MVYFKDVKTKFENSKFGLQTQIRMQFSSIHYSISDGHSGMCIQQATLSASVAQYT